MLAATFSFLKSLKKNNDKSWFDAHRPAYEAAKKDMEQFVQSVIDAHAKTDSSLSPLKAKECMFRINRDVRFSKNKSPYKTNFGASINPDGRKAMTPGYYIHIAPGNSFVGGGLYMPAPADLKAVRQEIDYNLAAFKKIIESKTFKKIYGGLSDAAEWKLSRVPQGFDKDSPAAPYLQYKSYVAMQHLPDEVLTGKKAKNAVTEAFAALQPLLAFLRANLGGE
ncbi:MAG: DUF2461 domain-containing protein [Flavihumibacter sp.]